MVPCARSPDEHDGVSRALVDPRRARRDATCEGKAAAVRYRRALIAELDEE
jgi:hypothetical protein